MRCSANLLSILLEVAYDQAASDNSNLPEGMGRRVTVSILVFFGSITGIILWLFFYAENFNGYQNIAIIVVILIGFIAAMGATWALWGIRQSASKKEKSKPE